MATVLDHGSDVCRGSLEPVLLSPPLPAPHGCLTGAAHRPRAGAQPPWMGRWALDLALVWKAGLTLGLVLLYYCFSIGITFYNKWLTKVTGVGGPGGPGWGIRNWERRPGGVSGLSNTPLRHPRE